VHIRPGQEQARARRGSDGAVDIAPGEDVRERAYGWDPARREPSAAHRQKANATFVLPAHPHRPGMLRRDAALPPRLPGRLTRPNGVRGGGWDGAAAPGASPCPWCAPWWRGGER
jgi:hypothetical protein